MKKYRHDRPGYLTFLCVLLLLGAVADIGIFFLMIYSPPPYSLVLSKWIYLAGFFLSAASGLFMLTAKNWARILFFTAYTPLCIWSYICVSMEYPLGIPAIVIRLIFLVIFCVALTMEGANRFFTGRDTFFSVSSSRKTGGGSSHSGYNY